MKTITRLIEPHELPIFFGVGIINRDNIVYTVYGSYYNKEVTLRLITDWIDAKKKWTVNGVDWNDFTVEEKVKESGEFWINIYPTNGMLPQMHPSKESANRNCSTSRIACVKIVWTEGDGIDDK